jgi:hypothetical protein
MENSVQGLRIDMDVHDWKWQLEETGVALSTILFDCTQWGATKVPILPTENFGTTGTTATDMTNN